MLFDVELVVTPGALAPVQLASLACSASSQLPLMSSMLFDVESSMLFDVESSMLFEVESSMLFDVESSMLFDVELAVTGTAKLIVGKLAGALTTETLDGLDTVVATDDVTAAAGAGAIVGRGVDVDIAA